MKAKIKSDSFWGDLANALVLSPVHREPMADAYCICCDRTHNPERTGGKYCLNCEKCKPNE